MRSLSRTFIDALKSVFLKPLLNLIIVDSTLCLEIRENYINVYYRGGNIIRIEEKQGLFKTSFDRKYLNKDLTKVPDLPNTLNNVEDVDVWIDAIPHLKHEMDLWFGKHPKNEREFQQLMLRENNFGNSAKGTDYFICDIEYANSNGRFDLIAVHWPSSSKDRKKNTDLGLSFIEMKYMDNALCGVAGIKKHIEDINEFLGNPENLSNLKDEMKTVFNQKLELGLIDNQNPIESFSENKPEYILALTNHDPDSSILKREMEGLPDCPNAKLKIAVSNFLGYGLYNQSIYSLDAFLNRFKSQVYAKTPMEEAVSVFHNKTAIITHGDVDGMICAAQLIHREKINYDVIFSNAKYINSALNRIRKGKTLPPHVYVTDIPANTETESIVKSLVECGIKLTWIDHHPWPDGLIKKLEKICTVLVYNEAMSTPAGILTGRWANDEGKYSDEIGNICYAFNKGTEWERNWFRLLSSYIGNSKQDVLERLAYNQDFTEDDLKRIEQKKEDEQRANEILNNKPNTMDTKTNKTMAVYDTSKNKGIYLGHKVFQYHDVDYCLIRISKTKWQLACHPSKRYSMQTLLGHHEVSGMLFSFAGRKNQLLAIESEGKDDNTKIHECLSKWLCEKL